MSKSPGIRGFCVEAAFQTATYTYDEIGNPITYGTYTYNWTQGRRLNSISEQSAGTIAYFKYNDEGIGPSRGHSRTDSHKCDRIVHRCDLLSDDEPAGQRSGHLQRKRNQNLRVCHNIPIALIPTEHHQNGDRWDLFSSPHTYSRFPLTFSALYSIIKDVHSSLPRPRAERTHHDLRCLQPPRPPGGI